MKSRIFGRLGLVAAIAALGMSGAVHAVPASATQTLPCPGPQGPGYCLPPIPPGAQVPDTPDRPIHTTGHDKITGQGPNDPAATAALWARVEASLAKQCADDPTSPACDHVAEAHCMATPDDPACNTADQVDCNATPDDPACQADQALADNAGADAGFTDPGNVDCNATPDDPACVDNGAAFADNGFVDNGAADAGAFPDGP